MQHHRGRSQRHQFIKEIQRHKISGKIQCNHDAIYQKEKAKEARFLSLMLDINKSITSRTHPHNTCKCHKNPTDAVNMKINRNLFHQIKQCQTFFACPDCRHSENCRYQQYCPNNQVKAMTFSGTDLHVFRMLTKCSHQQKNPGYHRQKYRY